MTREYLTSSEIIAIADKMVGLNLETYIERKVSKYILVAHTLGFEVLIENETVVINLEQYDTMLKNGTIDKLDCVFNINDIDEQYNSLVGMEAMLKPLIAKGNDVLAQLENKIANLDMNKLDVKSIMKQITDFANKK